MGRPDCQTKPFSTGAHDADGEVLRGREVDVDCEVAVQCFMLVQDQ